MKAKLPVELGRRYFGPELVRFILYQYHHYQTTQPLLLEQLREYGIDIFTSQIEWILSRRHEQLHEEKDAWFECLHSVHIRGERHIRIATEGALLGSLLNQLLKRIHGNKAEHLRVLERPDIPLHTNSRETDIRDYVKKRKVSGGTRSDEGQRCRDTFISLKKTCRKLGISFWGFLHNRLCSSELVRERTSAPTY